MPENNKPMLPTPSWLEACLQTGKIATAAAAAVGAALHPQLAPLIGLTGVMGYEAMSIAAGGLLEGRIQDFLVSSSPTISQLSDTQRSSPQFVDATRITVREALNEMDDEKRKAFVRIYKQHLKGIRDNKPQETEFDAFIRVTKNLSSFAYSALLCIDEMARKEIIPQIASSERAIDANREYGAEPYERAFAETMMQRFKDAAWIRKAMIELDGAGLVLSVTPDAFGPREDHLEAYTLTLFGKSYMNWISAGDDF